MKLLLTPLKSKEGEKEQASVVKIQITFISCVGSQEPRRQDMQAKRSHFSESGTFAICDKNSAWHSHRASSVIPSNCSRLWNQSLPSAWRNSRTSEGIPQVSRWRNCSIASKRVRFFPGFCVSKSFIKAMWIASRQSSFKEGKDRLHCWSASMMIIDRPYLPKGYG